MKWMIALWMIFSGLGLSYSILKERGTNITQLKEMEHSLKQLAYYIHQWKMPLEEAFLHVAGEPSNGLAAFFLQMQEVAKEKTVHNLGEVWREKCGLLGLNNKLWTECFFKLPMESEALYRRLTERAAEIRAHREALEHKYKEEQRLIMTMGIFTGCFLCLILW